VNRIAHWQPTPRPPGFRARALTALVYLGDAFGVHSRHSHCLSGKSFVVTYPCHRFAIGVSPLGSMIGTLAVIVRGNPLTFNGASGCVVDQYTVLGRAVEAIVAVRAVGAIVFVAVRAVGALPSFLLLRCGGSRLSLSPSPPPCHLMEFIYILHFPLPSSRVCDAPSITHAALIAAPSTPPTAPFPCPHHRTARGSSPRPALWPTAR
jgi:hypothetical protein